MAMIIAVALGFVLLGALASLLAISPGRPAPLRDADGNVIPGSRSERVTVQIGGIPQTMVIQGVDPASPVLLFLHGGPGMPEFFREEDCPTGLERHFTMVRREQRGAGMSFSSDIPPETTTMAQMIADTIEIADHQRDRFGQDRIVLLGHSRGSHLGIQVAAAAPGLANSVPPDPAGANLQPATHAARYGTGVAHQRRNLPCPRITPAAALMSM